MELYQTLDDGYKKYGDDRSYVLLYSGILSDRYKYDINYLELEKEVMKRIEDTGEVERIEKLLKQIS